MKISPRLSLVGSSLLAAGALTLALSSSGVFAGLVACAPPPDSTSSSGGSADCDDPCNDICVDYQTDSANCGRCGNTCVPGDVCRAGTCVVFITPTPDAEAPVADAGPDAEAPPSLDCAYYCDKVMSACAGTNAQYASRSSCLAFCARLPRGALTDTSGNTLGCRIQRAVASGASPAAECANAGPSGGDRAPSGDAGTCGDICEAFCGVGTEVCPGATSECTQMLCPAYAAAPSSYSTALTTGSNVGCRLYHLTLAAEDAGACANVGAGSPACQ